MAALRFTQDVHAVNRPAKTIVRHHHIRGTGLDALDGVRTAGDDVTGAVRALQRLGDRLAVRFLIFDYENKGRAVHARVLYAIAAGDVGPLIRVSVVSQPWTGTGSACAATAGREFLGGAYP